MDKILANNTLLKVVSVIIAIVMWAYIIIIIDAPTEKTFREVPITTVNEKVFSDNGYCIERLSVQSASVKIEGSRKVISKFDNSNISAKLDFSDVNYAKLSEEGVVTVNLTVESEFGEVVGFTPSTVDVHIETTKYKDIEVKSSIIGETMEGYVNGDINLSQNTIRIFGAQSHIDSVAYAGVSMDLINTDYSAYTDGVLSQDCSVKLYDESGKEVQEKDSKWIWNNTATIKAECPLYKKKKVRVVPSVDDSISASSLRCEPSTVEIYGDNENIQSVNQVRTKTISRDDFGDGNEIWLELNLPSWAKTVDNVTEVKVSANTD